jgi:hypothetical protein
MKPSIDYVIKACKMARWTLYTHGRNPMSPVQPLNGKLFNASSETLVDVSDTSAASQDMMEVETGRTEVTAFAAAGVPEAEAVAEVLMKVGTAEMMLEIVTDEALMMNPGVAEVVAEATVVIEVDTVAIEVDTAATEVDTAATEVGMVATEVGMVVTEEDMVATEEDTVGSVLTHVHLIPLAVATMNPQVQQLPTPNLLLQHLLHRYVSFVISNM